MIMSLLTLQKQRSNRGLLNSRSNSIEQILVNAWYKPRSWILLLIPIAWLFRLLVALRHYLLQALHQGHGFPVPLVVIGNITLGGSGKTPLIIGLVNSLHARGYRVAVISRGYGASAVSHPLEVSIDTPASLCGDEPLLIKRKLHQLGCTVVVDANRKRAADYVIANCACDLILSDDGLQHYKLHRDAEIAVIDGARGFGNGHCLPAGPLREPINRLKDTDFIVSNGSPVKPWYNRISYQFDIQPLVFRHLASGELVQADAWSISSVVHAVAAIGNPQRFAKTLESLGLTVILHPNDDHKPLDQSMLDFNDGKPVIITEKDAVKLQSFEGDHIWILEVDISLDNHFVDSLLNRINLAPNKGS